MVTNCHQLKLKSSDGKFYSTGVVDIEVMFRKIESIPSKNAESIKQCPGMNAKQYKLFKVLRKNC